MNNDSTPTSAADLPTSPQNNNSGAVDSPESHTQRQDAQTPAQKRALVQAKKKYEYISAIMNNLDISIYAELCILYYMDCSFFRLLIRVLAQVMFLTPKPNFVPPMPKHRPYIGAIFGPNVLCILLHIFTARSEASEAMRGYLHGGIIIDLIGQKGPTSKIHLVLLDMLVTALQCFMLAVHVERERLAAILLPTASDSQRRVRVVSAQDHDAEERGVMRGGVASNGDIELQPMATTTTSNVEDNPEGTADTDQERERLLAEPAQREDSEEEDYPLDIFYSGTSVVGEFHILHTIRTQWGDYGNATSSALQTVGFNAEFARMTADRRIGAVRRGLEALSN